MRELHKVEEDTAEAAVRRTLAEELEIRIVVGEEHHIEVPAHHIAVEEAVHTRVEEEEHRIVVVGHKEVEGNLWEGDVSSMCKSSQRIELTSWRRCAVRIVALIRRLISHSAFNCLICCYVNRMGGVNERESKKL